MNDSLSKGDQARHEILEAAMRLFISQGYNGTSMRAIAQEAGNRAVAGLYNHFPTKQAIFEALIEEYNPYQELIDTLASGHGDTAAEYMHNALTSVMVMMTKHTSFLHLVQIDLREFEGRTVAHVFRNNVLPQIFPLIVQLKSLPGLKPIEEPVLMRLFASLVIGFITTEQLVAAQTLPIFEGFSREEFASRIANAAIYGIAAPCADDKKEG